MLPLNRTIVPNEAMRLLSEYERGLKGYTYLNFQNGTPARRDTGVPPVFSAK